MKRKFVVLLVALLVSFNLAVGFKVLTGNAVADSNTDYFNLTVFTRALQLVRQDYVDENKTSYRGRTYAALTAKEVKFAGPPERQHWGGVFAHFEDPCRNVLTLLGG